MKTPEEAYDFILDNLPDNISVDDFDILYCKLINQLQTEAWNEAIEAAAENVKLKKGFVGKLRNVPTLVIDKHSILKLKK